MKNNATTQRKTRIILDSSIESARWQSVMAIEG
jgi:hypothetical protein